ncbi:MAG TPA: NTP transferase domain-containing protein [Lachnospiraceae bacterium]|nr:NTP transferase domain-containing protein [Lachnospiraceae bacterium]
MRSFQNSHKKHLFITGSRLCGKSTLLGDLLTLLDLPDGQKPQGIITQLTPGSHVTLTNCQTGESAVIGRYVPEEKHTGNLEDSLPDGCQMEPVREGFLTLGMDTLYKALQSDCPWFIIDEIGYLESNCEAFLDTLRELLEKKQVIAVIRKQELPFLNELRSREDAFVYDLETPLLPIGCVIMASGISSRFGSNKLLADLNGKPLISHVLDTIEELPFLERIVVTRSEEVENHCKRKGFATLIHQEPWRSDTIRLGLKSLLFHTHTVLNGCFFLQADQPYVSKETLETMALSFSQSPKGIYRLSYEKQMSSPVLFADTYFMELLSLSDGESGSTLTRKYPEQVHAVPARDEYELFDIDTKEDLQFMHSHEMS